MALIMSIANARGIQNRTTTSSTLTSVPMSASHTIATGHGPSFASSCQTALWEWHQKSTDWYTIGSNSPVATSTYFQPALAPVISATSLATLCDGHPRAVGAATELPDSIISTDIVTETNVPTDFPTPIPCSIEPSDCVDLFAAYESLASTALYTIATGQTISAPPCATDAGRSYSFSAATCYEGDVGIRASKVQLLYWPIRTVENSDYFCNYHYYPDIVTPKTLSGTPTGSGPNTFVTGSLTITSPVRSTSHVGRADPHSDSITGSCALFWWLESRGWLRSDTRPYYHHSAS